VLREADAPAETEAKMPFDLSDGKVGFIDERVQACRYPIARRAWSFDHRTGCSPKGSGIAATHVADPNLWRGKGQTQLTSCVDVRQ